MKIDFDADNIDFRYVDLIDRTEAKKLNEELVSLKETYPKAVENLRKKGSEKNRFIENTNVQKTSESVATNFLLEKLNKAGIETIIDKVAYENMLAYVKEVNISLEMLEADLYPVQMMEEKEKELSDYHTENILQLARSKEFLQVEGNQFGDKSQAASKAKPTFRFRKVVQHNYISYFAFC